MNGLTRLGWIAASIVLTTLPLAEVGCGGETAAPGGTTGSSSDGVVVKSAVVSTSTVSAPGNACSSLASVAASAPATLCDPGAIALPVAADGLGCTGDEVSSITFGCVVATVPPTPAPGVCIPVPIEDPGALLPAGVTAALPYIPAAVCPALGLVPPPDLPTNGPATGVSLAGGGAPALPTTWPDVPVPDAGLPPDASTWTAPIPPDAGTLPGGSLPPIITCCTPDPSSVPDAAIPAPPVTYSPPPVITPPTPTNG